MTTTTSTRTVHVHRVYIRATAQRVWDALLSPEWTDRYGYGGSRRPGVCSWTTASRPRASPG